MQLYEGTSGPAVNSTCSVLLPPPERVHGCVGERGLRLSPQWPSDDWYRCHHRSTFDACCDLRITFVLLRSVSQPIFVHTTPP
eukprot:15267236-Alexandrium_andersonii.AAC.1